MSQIEHIGMVAADTFTWSSSMGCYRWNHEKIGLAVLAHLAERGMVVPGPDGEPLDVRPLLRALGTGAVAEGARIKAVGDSIGWHNEVNGGTWLKVTFGITGPLADACLAAAEVDG